MSSPKVVFIIVYFGSLPRWFQYYLRSVSNNSDFNWLVFNDSSSNFELPDNLKIIRLSKNQFEELVSSKLDTRFVLHHGYKLCDMKPAYGHIFSDYIEQYDYWGYGDLDLIYGEMKRFIGPLLSEQYDIISASERILVGHCTLFRNTRDLALLYQECSGFMESFGNYDYQNFDESIFAIHVLNCETQNRFRICRKSIQTDDCIIWWSGRPRFIVLWIDGKIIDIFASKQFGYFHFIQSKSRSSFSCPVQLELGNFMLCDDGFLPLKSKFLSELIFKFAITFVATVPYYAKHFVKMVLPRRLILILLRRV